MPAAKPAVKKTPLTTKQKEIITNSVCMALSKQVHAETWENVCNAFDRGFKTFFDEIYKTPDQKAAIEVLVRDSLVEIIPSVEIRDYVNFHIVTIDAGIEEFSVETGIGCGKNYSKGKTIISGRSMVGMKGKWPNFISEKIKYAGDEYEPLRKAMLEDVTKQLLPYKKYAHVARVTRATVHGSKYVEDLKADMPEIADLINEVTKVPPPVPTVISPAISASLSSLSPIRVCE